MRATLTLKQDSASLPSDFGMLYYAQIGDLKIANIDPRIAYYYTRLPLQKYYCYILNGKQFYLLRSARSLIQQIKDKIREFFKPLQVEIEYMTLNEQEEYAKMAGVHPDQLDI